MPYKIIGLFVRMIPKWFLFTWLLLSPWIVVLGEDGVECEFECPEKNGSFADPCTCRYVWTI